MINGVNVCHAAVLETMRSEKKRKVTDDEEYVAVFSREDLLT